MSSESENLCVLYYEYDSGKLTPKRWNRSVKEVVIPQIVLNLSNPPKVIAAAGLATYALFGQAGLLPENFIDEDGNLRSGSGDIIFAADGHRQRRQTLNSYDLTSHPGQGVTAYTQTFALPINTTDKIWDVKKLDDGQAKPLTPTKNPFQKLVSLFRGDDTTGN